MSGLQWFLVGCMVVVPVVVLGLAARFGGYVGPVVSWLELPDDFGGDS